MKALNEMSPEEIQAYIAELEAKNETLETEKATIVAEKEKIETEKATIVAEKEKIENDAKTEIDNLKTKLKTSTPGAVVVKIGNEKYKIISPKVTIPKSITGGDSVSMTAEDLKKNPDLCKTLIEKGSAVFELV